MTSRILRAIFLYRRSARKAAQGQARINAERVQYGGLNSETRRKFEEARQRIGSKMQPHIEAVRESEHLTAEDLAVHVGAVPVSGQVRKQMEQERRRRKPVSVEQVVGIWDLGGEKSEDYVRRLHGDEVAIAQRFYDEVCAEAEKNMLKTGVLSGAHYAAMQTVLKKWQEAAKER